MIKFIFYFLPVIVASVFLFACNSSETEKNRVVKNVGDTSMKHPLRSQQFGNIDGKQVIQYILTNKNGMVVKIIDYGATITNIMVPDKNKQMDDVVLGFDSLSGYLKVNNPYFGCIVGRYANRIANAKFVLSGKTYRLAANNNGNSLHGGTKGFDKVIWEAKGDDQAPEYTALGFQYHSKDGEEGYPGNVEVTVLYKLSSDNELKIDYIATSDKSTPINLTNHSYFNLSGGKDSTVLDHELMLKADKYTEVNDNLIPTGKLPEVKNSPMDFTSLKKIGKDINKVKGGYDHNWVLNKKQDSLKMIAALYHPGSGRYMEVYTTQPGVQFYSGNFLDGSLSGKNGIKYIKHAGMCLETQHFPDSPNQPSFPNTILKPGEIFHAITIYKFSVKE